MRETEQLQFNPVRFTWCGTNGSVGEKGGCQNFFRSALSQNIAYAVYREAKSAAEIADDLGVSPVYVKDEADYLEEYGFLTVKDGKYLANILINEPSEEECALREKIYAQGAARIADGLYDALQDSGMLEDRAHLWGGISGELTMGEDPPGDRNLLLWTLIPYLAAMSGEEIQEREQTVSFDEAASIRPDGGHNICEAWIDPPGTRPILPEQWCGPAWNGWNGFTIWQIDTEWSGRRITENYEKESERDRSLLMALYGGGELRPEEYAVLCERGFLAVARNENGIKTGFRCVWIEGREMKRRLIELGNRVKADCWDELRALKAAYVETVMRRTPERLRKMQAFGLGYLFHSDGLFMYHCMKRLLGTGRLRVPAEEERRSLTLLVVNETV